MNFEDTYKQCTSILKPYVKAKKMGPMYRHQLNKSMKDNIFLKEEIFDKEENINKIIGFCLLRYRKRDNVIILEKIAVNELEAGKGTGKKLMLEAIDLAKGRKSDIILDVSYVNKEVISFYEKFGFETIGEKIVGKDTKLIIMQLKLNG